MRFWDSSAIVPLVFDEPASATLRALVDDGTRLTVWWGTVVECSSAVARRERSGELGAEEVREALMLLNDLAGDWAEVPPTQQLRGAARRVVFVHDLRAAEAFQIAAARAAGDDEAESIPFVTLDDRLAAAARREGFPILP